MRYVPFIILSLLNLGTAQAAEAWRTPVTSLFSEALMSGQKIELTLGARQDKVLTTRMSAIGWITQSHDRGSRGYDSLTATLLMGPQQTFTTRVGSLYVQWAAGPSLRYKDQPREPTLKPGLTSLLSTSLKTHSGLEWNTTLMIQTQESQGFLKQQIWAPMRQGMNNQWHGGMEITAKQNPQESQKTIGAGLRWQTNTWHIEMMGGIQSTKNKQTKTGTYGRIMTAKHF